ncbi:hypothetical protein DSOL_4569 [Desulfosporosinus metallidurans]|uniref:Uncharacterized protein n=1 Tax=Desulfosporosinus metallidurans TaxID=1888891 RepID=A0A1Q8QJ62_9FIRM|nr:hypothetical protein DSOL_4569 [Desulfosporosinus metallidurans]
MIFGDERPLKGLEALRLSFIFFGSNVLVQTMAFGLDGSLVSLIRF